MLSRHSADFAEVSRKFIDRWSKGSPPSVSSISIFAIGNNYLDRKWADYRQSLKIQTPEEHFHGTALACDILTSQALCSGGNCGICGISCAGMDPSCIRTNIDFQRFGHGFYLAPHSSKCHDYTTQNSRGHTAMLLCAVLPGQKYNLKHNRQQLTSPPRGYDSVCGQIGDKLNYPEIVVYNSHAVMPHYIIIY